MLMEFAEDRRLPLQDAAGVDGGEGPLDAGLAVIKVAAHGADLHVLPLLGHHLGLLHRRDPLIREEHQDAGALHVVKALQGGLAGVAGGGGEDDDLVLHPLLFPGGGNELGQHGQGHVLEGGGGPVEQLQGIVLPHLFKRGQLLGGKFALVGPADQGIHALKARQQMPQDYFRHAQGRQIQAGLPVKGPLCQTRVDIQSAVGGDALQHGGGVCRLMGAACALIQHVFVLL